MGKRICNVVGARPNFMKMGPVLQALRAKNIDHFLVHTGQHYDQAMSEVFFQELKLPRPDINLGVGSGSHAEQTAAVMVAFEKMLKSEKPDAVLVAGDVNSTLATALTAAKLDIPVGHVEAGLRSFDRTMPEEINRVLTDHISRWLFVSEPSGVANLQREGIDGHKIHLVGNCMVDSLFANLEYALSQAPWKTYDLTENGYAVLTLHRPSNVDDDARLAQLVLILNDCAERLPIVFPVHPRTRNRLKQGNSHLHPQIRLVEPLPYHAFLGLMAKAKLALTDSGGLQEETTALKVPCLTLRANTERPVTITIGTNRLVGDQIDAIPKAVDDVLAGRWPEGQVPPLWDGKTAERIVEILSTQL